MTPAALWTVAVATAAAILSFDLMLPLGVAGGVPYVLLVFIALKSPSRNVAVVLAAVGSALTVVGFFLSEPGSTLWVVLTNRALALFVIWISVLPVVRYQRVRFGGLASRLDVEDIMNSVMEAIIISDERAVILAVNKSAEAMFGYKAKELVGKSDAILRPEPERTQHQKQIDEFLRSGREVFVDRGAHQERGLRKDGSVFPMEMQVGELRRDGQRLFVGTTRDVSARVTAQNSQRQTQERFEKAFHASLHLASLTRISDRRIIDVNEKWLSTIGHTREDVIGSNAADLDLWADETQREEMYRVLRTDGRLSDAEATWKAKDGRQIDIQISVERLDLDEGPAMLLVAHDQTERKRAEKALRESEDRFAKAFHASPLMTTLMWLEDGRRVDVNDAWLEGTGYSREVVVGHTSSEFSLWVDEDRRTTAYKLMRETGSLRGFEAKWRRSDDAIIDVRIQAERLDIDGEPAILSIARDITEERRVAEALKAAKEEAEYANRTKTEFLANMSHELRTPLNAVIGFAEMIEKELYGPLGSDKYKESAAHINESATHLLSLINDLLDVSKIEVGKMDMLEEDFEVGAIIEQMLRMIEPRAAQAGVLVESSGFTYLPRLFADPRMLKQIVLNLVSNAVKFTPRGGSVVVGAEIDRSGALAITVRDTGIGMAEEDLSTALAAFGQIRRGTESRYEGTGLGLPLTKSLIEMHGGEIEIDSTVGVGTAVTVRYPASRVCQSAASGEILRAKAL